MLGQEKFENEVSKLNKLPRVIILSGEYGSEFDEAIDLMASKFSLSVKDITEMEDYEDVIMEAFEPTLFVIRSGNKFDRRKQNKLLKTMEDMPLFSYLVIIEEGGSIVLGTVSNRAIHFHLDDYNSGKYCRTVGQGKELGGYDVEELESICDKLILKTSEASLCNVYTIADKINFTDEYEKYPIWLFENVLKDRCKTVGTYRVTSKLLNIFSTFFLNYLDMTDKKALFNYCLSKLWYSVRGHNSEH